MEPSYSFTDLASVGSSASDAPGYPGTNSSGDGSDEGTSPEGPRPEGSPPAALPPAGGLSLARTPPELLVRLASNGARPCMGSVLALFTAESCPAAPSALEPLLAVTVSEPAAAEPAAAGLPLPSLPSGRRRRPSGAIELGSPCERILAKLTVPSSTRLAPNIFSPSLGTAAAEAQPLLVAAGGPSALLDSLSDVLPLHLTLQRLTHPM